MTRCLSSALLLLPALAGCARYEHWYNPFGFTCPAGTQFRTSDDGDHGSRRWCQEPDGKPSDLYVNGREPGSVHGPWFSYYKGGRLRQEGVHDHGKLVGRWRRYWEDGAMAVDEMHDPEGRLTGTYHSWHRNGITRMEGNVEEGYRAGDWIAYRTDGTVLWAGRYTRGRACGPWRYGEPGGAAHAVDHGACDSGGEPPPGAQLTLWEGSPRPKRLESFRDGMPDGLFAEWEWDGTPIEIKVVERNQEVWKWREAPGPIP